jgi:periplasmic protein TonB
MEQPAHDLRPFQSTVVQSTERRAISVGVVAVIHAVAIYALATGLASQLVHKVSEIEAKVVQEKPPDLPKTPPPPPPEMTKPPPPFIPPPDINLQQTQTAPTITQVTTITPPPVVAPPKPVAPPVTAAVLASGLATKCASSYYPPLAIRLNHEGVTTMTVHVAADGSVTGADVADGSGHDELDQAAVKCITSAWRFTPAKQNGQPVPSTKQYRIVWKLTG